MPHRSCFAPTTLGQRLRERDRGWFGVTAAFHAPNEQLRPHAHRYPAITVVGRGSFGLCIDNETVDCSTRGLFFKQGEHRHSNLVGTAGCHSLILELRSDRNPVDAGDLPLPKTSFWTEDSVARRLAGAIAREFCNDDIAADLALEGLVLELVAALVRGPHGRPDRLLPRWLAEVEAVLRERFRESLGLSEVAGIVGRHPAHVARTFRHHHGCSLGDYLRRVRLEHAAAWLRETDRAIGEIALDAGFYDQAHFGRCFRQWMAVTPTAYRAAHRG